MADKFVMVPVEPTEAMCRAGLSSRHDDLAKSIWKAMLSAAPPAPQGELPPVVVEALAEMDKVRAVGKPFIPRTAYDVIRDYLKAPPAPQGEMAESIAARLQTLLPNLEYSRETHVQWANCSPESRARNPDIGDADFHNKCVAEYDERIAAITEGIAALRRITREGT